MADFKTCSWCEQEIKPEYREHYRDKVFCSHEHTVEWRDFHENGIDVHEEQREYTTTHSLKGNR